MHQEKKITKEDTWKTDELRKHIRGGGREEDRGRRREEYERQHRGAESLERRPRDPEREARRERDKQRDERKNREKDRHPDRRKERSDDRIVDREEREKGRRRETDEGADSSRYQDGDRESRDRIHYRGEKENRDRERERTRERGKEKDITKDRERERHRDREKEAGERERHREKEAEERERHREKEAGERERHRDREKEAGERERHRDRVKEAGERERHREKEAGERERHRDREAGERERHRDRDREAEERERERRREERERRRENESNYMRKDKDRQEESSRRDGHKDRERLKDSEHRDKRKDRERRERHSDREQTTRKEDKEYREHRRKEKEEKERRHRQKPQADAAESRRHDGDPREEALKERKSSEDRHRADREGAERDRLRERRRREEDDPKREETNERSREKRSHQDPKEKRDVKTKEVLGQSESVWRSSHKELSDTEEPVEKQERVTECQHDEDGDAQDYEEDFEDYEEDFEEGSESGGEEEEQKTPSQEEEREEREEKEELSPQTRKQIAAIQRAMKEENDRVGSSQTRLNMEEEEEEEEDRPSRTRGSEMRPQQGKFIDFVAAKHREVNKKVTCQQKKRSVELLRLIDLDYSITFSLLDLPPVNEYDMYIKSFGTTNTKQAYVQCNEDNSDRGVQTEELESSEMWTQHPAEWNAVCGGPNLAQEDSPSSSKMNVDSQHLVRFLRSASQVVAVLLEEGRAERQSLQKLGTQEDTVQSFSDSCLQLNTKLPFLHGHPISLLHFSQTQTQTMLSVHSPTEKPSAVRLDSNTIICVWNIWEPSRPQKILLYESEVRSCCLSPGKATLVFAGTSVGSVVLWDLREPAADHYTLSIGDIDWTLRHPTFSTDAVLAVSGHMSSVSSVEAVPAAVSQSWGPEHPLLASDEESSGLAFQLASLDENGVLNLWVVLELPKPNDAGSQTDLGLRPGGKVKLLHSSTLLTSESKTTRDAIKTSPPQALLIKFLPSDPSHFFIGTNMGLVNHGTNHGLKAPPKFYRPTLVGARPVDVTCIDFSPFEGTLFLVGCGDGSVRLHTVASERPVLEWSGSTAGVPVVSVQWAQTRPAVFCVLDATSTLHMWDLLDRDSEPVITENTEADRVTAMATFGDPSKQNMFSGIALARQSGKIEMQYFSKRFTVPDSADLGKLQTLKL